jgi:hypothetical protein
MTKLNLDGANTPPEERTRRSDAIPAEEYARQAENSAKTTMLRGLREARDATEREVAEAEARRVARIKRRAKPKKRGEGGRA